MIEKFKIIRSALWQKIKEKPKKFILWLVVFILALCYLFNDAVNVFAAETGDSSLVVTNVAYPEDAPPIPLSLNNGNSVCDYILCKSSAGQYYILVFDSESVFYANNGYIRSSSAVSFQCNVFYQNMDNPSTWISPTGTVYDSTSGGVNGYCRDVLSLENELSLIVCSSRDIYSDSSLETVVFQHPTDSPTIGGMTSEVITKTVTKEIVGLVPLVIGFLVVLLALWKGLRMVYRHLRAA